jgi:anti-anti-sigma factor
MTTATRQTTFEQELVRDIVVIRVRGSIRAGESTTGLDNALKSATDANHMKMVLNLRKVPWIHRAGLSKILACMKRMDSTGGRMKFVVTRSFQRSLQSIFCSFPDQMTPLLYSTEKKALADFADTPPSAKQMAT